VQNEWFFDPVLFGIGPFQVRWYGLMYVLGYVLGGWGAAKLAKKGFFNVPPEKVDSLITHLIIAMFIGARFFYVFIYNWADYSNDLMGIFQVWKGGLSFHGALTGMIIGGYLFGKKNGCSVGEVMDVVALAGTPGLFFGRMGNFINGELYGRVTDSPFGMMFPGGGPYPRHPSQLYEAIFEGLVLSAILWFIYLKIKPKVYGVISSFFLMGYAFFRFFIEFFREADPQLGYYFGGTITMGQILCFIMFLIGLTALFLSKKMNWVIVYPEVTEEDKAPSDTSPSQG
jgi:phosphatidylglycerol:prolipoprotein diacylglycerol transferase